MTKQGTHSRLLMESLDHVRSMDNLLSDIALLKQTVSL